MDERTKALQNWLVSRYNTFVEIRSVPDSDTFVVVAQFTKNKRPKYLGTFYPSQDANKDGFWHFVGKQGGYYILQDLRDFLPEN